jgi:hypothetical protein
VRAAIHGLAGCFRRGAQPAILAPKQSIKTVIIDASE